MSRIAPYHFTQSRIRIRRAGAPLPRFHIRLFHNQPQVFRPRRRVSQVGSALIELIERLQNGGVAVRQSAQPKTALTVGEARLRSRAEASDREARPGEYTGTGHRLASGVDENDRDFPLLIETTKSSARRVS